MGKLLQRGIDPYADADVADERTGWVGPFANTVSGTTEVFMPALYKGRVREIIGVVRVAVTVADATITVNADASAVGTVVAPFTGSTIGDIIRAAFIDGADNSVNQLSNLSVVSDGGATAGAVDWYIRVDSEEPAL